MAPYILTLAFWLFSQILHEFPFYGGVWGVIVLDETASENRTRDGWWLAGGIDTVGGPVPRREAIKPSRKHQAPLSRRINVGFHTSF